MSTYIVTCCDDDTDIVEGFLRNLSNMTRGDVDIRESKPLPPYRRKRRAASEPSKPDTSG